MDFIPFSLWKFNFPLFYDFVLTKYVYCHQPNEAKKFTIRQDSRVLMRQLFFVGYANEATNHTFKPQENKANQKKKKIQDVLSHL
jgi:hypothetical protein